MEQTIRDLLERTKEYEDSLLGIETEDTSNEDLEGIPYSTDDVRITTRMYSIYQVFHWIENEILVLQPDFQRNYVWDITKKSLLIESLMLSIPIPAFYFQEDAEGNKMVIDGLQRLSTIYFFMRDEFPLKGLQYLKDYNEIHFSELPKKYRVRIMETQLNVNVLDSKCDEQVKFDVFRRVNTGGIPLNSQEIRNIMASTRVRQLLRDMSQSEQFIRATRGRVKDTRMDAQELCLRFIVFYVKYDSLRREFLELRSLAQMLDKMIILLNNVENEFFDLISTVFKESLERCYALLGEEAFSKETSKHIINKPLFISWTVVLANRQIEPVVLKEKHVQAVKLQQEYFRDGEYFNAITSSTTTRKNIGLQFEAVERIMEELFL